MANIVTSKTRGYTGSRSSPSGKGSARRPSNVPKAVYDENWERTFGKGKRTDKPKKRGAD